MKQNGCNQYRGLTNKTCDASTGDSAIKTTNRDRALAWRQANFFWEQEISGNAGGLGLCDLLGVALADPLAHGRWWHLTIERGRGEMRDGAPKWPTEEIDHDAGN